MKIEKTVQDIIFRIFENILEYRSMEHCYCIECLQKIFLRKCLWEIKSAKYFKAYKHKHVHQEKQ